MEPFVPSPVPGETWRCTAMTKGFRKPLIAGAFVSTFLLLGGVQIWSYQNAIALISSTNRVEQIEVDINHLIEISASLQESKAEHLAYLLQGQEEDRQNSRLALEHLEQHLQSLERNTAGNTQLEADLAELRTLVAQRQDLLHQSLTLAARLTSSQLNESLPSSQGELISTLRDNQRAVDPVVSRIRREKASFLNDWETTLVDQTRRHLLIEHLGSALIFAAVLGLYALLYRQLVQRQKAEALQQKLLQDKEMGDLKLRFFSMVSHGFRTPLSIILGSAQLLAEKPCLATSAPALKNVDRIQTSARSMNRLLSDILTLTRAEAGKLDLYPTDIDLEAFCLNLVEDIRITTHPLRKIQFISQGHCSHACLDEKLLQAMLTNLLSNAIKYSAAESPVSLTLRCEPHEVVFEIRDRGQGIPPEDLANLCEPFFRGSNAGKSVGAGLGLAVSKKCVELHHGRLDIQSEVGQGTTVVVRLPRGQMP